MALGKQQSLILSKESALAVGRERASEGGADGPRPGVCSSFSAMVYVTQAGCQEIALEGKVALAGSIDGGPALSSLAQRG